MAIDPFDGTSHTRGQATEILTAVPSNAGLDKVAQELMVTGLTGDAGWVVINDGRNPNVTIPVTLGQTIPGPIHMVHEDSTITAFVYWV